MALVAILGDCHFGARGNSIYFHNYFDRFYTNVFFPYLKQHNITDVLQLGDLFDHRKQINFNSLYMARKYFFDPMENQGVRLITFPGNHDSFYKNSIEVNSLDLLLGEYPNIFIINKIREVDLSPTLSAVIVPWLCEENEDTALDFLDKTKATLCAGHFEIQGFEMNRGHVCDTGFDRSAFKKFDLVLSGHYHTRSNKDNITYVGTPYELTWSDFADPKGFHILDTETLDLTFVENPYTMHNKLDYNDVDSTQEKIMSQNFDGLEGTYVKIIIENKTNLYWYDQFLERLERANPAGIKIVDNSILIIDDELDQVDEAEDTVSILKTYIDSLDTEVDKSSLVSVVRTLYNEALNY